MPENCQVVIVVISIKALGYRAHVYKTLASNYPTCFSFLARLVSNDRPDPQALCVALVSHTQAPSINTTHKQVIRSYSGIWMPGYTYDCIPEVFSKDPPLLRILRANWLHVNLVSGSKSVVVMVSKTLRWCLWNTSFPWGTWQQNATESLNLRQW